MANPLVLCNCINECAIVEKNLPFYSVNNYFAIIAFLNPMSVIIRTWEDKKVASCSGVR